MFTLAICAQKGGVGKTTLALHLAVEARAIGPVALIDIDPQSSAAQWGDHRESAEPSVVACPPVRLGITLDAARKVGASIAIIDTAPHAEAPSLAAARAADFVLIVSRPGILDIRAIGATVEIAKLANKPAAVVINAAPPIGGQAAEAAEAVREGYGAKIVPVLIRQRAIFGHALVASKVAQEVDPACKAAAEIAELWTWLAQHVNVSTSQAVEEIVA